MAEELREFIAALPEYDAQQFLAKAQLRANSIPYVGIAYAGKDRETLVLDLIPTVGRYERLEVKVSDVLGMLKMPEVRLGAELVPSVKVFIRKGAVVLNTRALVVGAPAEGPSAPAPPVPVMPGMPAAPQESAGTTGTLEGFEKSLADARATSALAGRVLEMHVTCDAGHTDDDLKM